MAGIGASLPLDATATNDEVCPHSNHSSLRSRLFLSGGLQTFGDAATADGFTFSHYPDPLCRPHAPAGVGILISFFLFFPLARELTDFPQTARARVLAVIRLSLKA
jgi:hypothetical protein